MSRKYRLYCSVQGCLNASKTQPELTFFKLPNQQDRVFEWLRLIGREDLADRIVAGRKSTIYRVCEHHFSQQDVLPTASRKILKKNAIPSLKLPCFQRTNLQKSQEENNFKPQVQVKLLVRTDTETQTQTEIEEVSCDQPTTSLSCDTASKRKLNAEASQSPKRLKLENPEDEIVKTTFHELCDKFLGKELALLVKVQTCLKIKDEGKRYNQDYIQFCFNLYFASPRAYQLLQSALHLPKSATLYKYSFPTRIDINERAMAILKIKVAHMTKEDKNCSVMIDSMPLKTNLFYNIADDKIVGFHEIEGWQSPEPAKYAIVMMVRGIFSNWNQPVSYALLSEGTNCDEVNKWGVKVLKRLIDIGLNVRTFVSYINSDLLDATKKRSISIEKPYFYLNDRKIFYIFDVPQLIIDVRNNLMQYDFHFGNSVAKHDHIVEFYNQDVKKNCRLAHKLTDSHIKPKKLDKMKVSYATQLLSQSVATGIYTYVEFNGIEETGRDTANFLKKMNDLFDCLNSSSLRHDYKYKRAFKGDDSQKTFLKEMLNFLLTLKIIDPKNGHDCTLNVTSIHGLQITIASLLLLFDDLKSEGHSYLFTRKLNLDVVRNFFSQIQTKTGEATNPTSRQFILAFKKTYFSNIMKCHKRGTLVDDLEKLLAQMTVDAIPTEVDEILSTNESDTSVQITTSDYNQLDLTDSLYYISAFLLHRCGEMHSGCQFLQSYIKPCKRSVFSADSHYLRYREFRKNNSQTLLAVPRDDFAEYVEKMDETFQSYFKINQMNGRVSEFLYKQMKDIDFVRPCFCFPKAHLIKLFIRMRIYCTIKFNNRAFRKSIERCKYFFVNIM